MGDFRFWQSVREAAAKEARDSPLPGYLDGPADAYRHIVGTAELRRRFGFVPAYAVATGNEVLGTHADGHPSETREMDDHNNAIGLSIGADATSYEEVVRRARIAIDSGIAKGGGGSDGTPRWQGSWDEPRDWPRVERRLPVEWPDDIPSAKDYRYGAEKFGTNAAELAVTPREREAATLDRLRDLPTGEWSDADVRAVIGSRPYVNSSMPEHGDWQERVRQYFEERHGGADPDETSRSDSGGRGGPVFVRSHDRSGPSGPVHVDSYHRAAGH